ncbi:hypothetical protein ICN48_12955 [Polynucleobacter sp. JS-Safj-400b-B2]|uniref:phage tail tape measure C-terminal domain-containing protein n=1 Tax=Polynucleobacter sp. JS-Safj-400b-B2 TaxID=2576921 RepID=UPI001C0BE463|nr:phage tail tape measure C-terminal domain-containing protein [Polynucleobacter sp. JS-Safj-400b-B2]MBU3627138.1 hypothetical protein [Polynucleobacter sp. JS-Safj-400b-B2]
MALAGLNIELNADLVKFQSAMEKAAYLAEKSGKSMEAAFTAANAHVQLLEGAIKGLGTSLGSLGVIAGAGAFVGMIKGSIETAAQMKHLSESTGVSVSALSAMSATAKVVGMDMDAVGLMVAKLDKVMWSAQGGNKAAEASFKKVGVSALDMTGHLRPTEDVMMDVAKRFSAMESGAAKTGLAMELFGKKGAQMIPFLQELAERGDLNGRITDKQAEAALRLEQGWLKLARSMNSWKFTAMESITPALERMMTILPELTVGVVSFIGVVKILPMAINGATAAINIMAASMGLAGATGVGIFGVLTGAVNRFTAALLTNPFTALAVAITATIAAAWLFQDKLITLGDTTASLGNWIGAVWDKVKEGLVSAWTSISDFLKPIFDGIAWAVSKTESALDRLNSSQKVKLGANNVPGKSIADDIAARAAARQAADDAAAKAAAKKSPSFDPVNTGDGKTYKTDPFTKAMSDMGGQKEALQWGIDHWSEYKGGIDASKEAMARFELEFGKFSDAQRTLENRSALTANQKDAYISAASALDVLTQKRKSYNDLIKFNNDTEKQRADDQAKLEFAAQEIKLRGLGTLEAQNLTIAYAEQLKLQERINTLLKDSSLSEKDKSDAIAKATQVSQNYSGHLQGINTERYTYDRSADAGLKEGYNSITEGATNSAAQIKSVMSGAFTTASDALAKFCETGKINFKALGVSIIDMMIKVASQQFFGNIMALAGGGVGSGGTGGMFGAISSMLPGHASGGGMTGGSASLVGELGPEIFIPNSSGTVVPNHQVRQAISGASSSSGNQMNGDVNVVINSNGQASSTGGAGNMSDLGTQIGAMVQKHIMDQMRPGGLLAG